MKRLALLSILLLFYPSFSFSQIYRAGQGSLQQEPSVSQPWEISVGMTGVFSPLEEARGEHLLNFQWGLSARVLYYVTPWLAVGPEGTSFFSASASPVLDKYHVRRAGIAGKFVPERDFSTRSYGILAAGVTRREAEYSFDWSESSNSSYLAFGIGSETDLHGSSFIECELRGIYNTKSGLGMFSRMSSRWEAEASVRVGVRF